MPALAVEHYQAFKVTNHFGLCARPVALLVQTVNRHNNRLYFKDPEIGDEWRSASIMSLMMGAFGEGMKVELGVVGPNADKCLEEIGQLFRKKFVEMDQEVLAEHQRGVVLYHMQHSYE